MGRELEQFIQLRVPTRPPLESMDDVGRYLDALIASLSDQQRSFAMSLGRYSSGIWTPNDGSGAGLGITGSGTWTKIGRLVVATAGVLYPANASGANAAVGGLPYPINSTYAPVAMCYINPDPISTLTVGAIGTDATAFFATSAGAARLNNTLAGDTLAFTLVYETN